MIINVLNTTTVSVQSPGDVINVQCGYGTLDSSNVSKVYVYICITSNMMVSS